MIVNREEFIKIMNSDVDINWEQTARDNISIIFKLYDKLEKIEEENKKLKEALEQIKEVLSFCYSVEGTETPCIDCKYYEECKLQPDDYVIKIASEGLKDENE